MLFENIRELYQLYKKPVNLIVLLVFIAWVVYIFFSYKIVVFAGENGENIKIQGYNLETIASNTAEFSELSATGFNIVPKSVNYFEAQQGDKAQIIAEQNIPFYMPFQKVTISLQDQKKLEKVYTGPYNCLAGDSTNIQTYSCTNPGYTYNYVTTKKPWRNEPVADISGQRSVVNYRDGLLGIRHIPGARYDKPLVYTDLSTGEESYYTLPHEIGANMLNISSVIPSDNNPDILLVASQNSKAFYVVNIASNTVVKKVEYPKDYSKNDGISCQVKDNAATCFIGKSHQTLDSSGDAKEEYQDKESSIYTFSLDETKNLHKQPVDSTIYITSIYRSSDGALYGLTDDSLLVKISDDGSSRVIARGVQSVSVADDIYFSRAEQLYKLNKKTLASNLALQTEGSVSKVQSFDGSIFVSLFAINKDGQTTSNIYTFKLTDKSVDGKNPKSLLSLAKLDVVRTIDYTDNKIFIRLWANDNSKTSAIKQIEAEIEKLPITKTDYQVEYYLPG